MLRPGLQGIKLTEKEQQELNYKRQVYELAKQRKDQETALQNRDEYRMPDSYDANGKVAQDERMKLLTKRFTYAFVSSTCHTHT